MQNTKKSAPRWLFCLWQMIIFSLFSFSDKERQTLTRCYRIKNLQHLLGVVKLKCKIQKMSYLDLKLTTEVFCMGNPPNILQIKYYNKLHKGIRALIHTEL